MMTTEPDYVPTDTKLISHWENPHNKIKLGVVRFREGAILPTRGTTYSSGFDIYAWIRELKGPKNTIPTWHDLEHVIEPNSLCAIKTGINLRIPIGYEVQVRSRSGLAKNNQLSILNSPGTIDSDFDGDFEDYEIKILLFNHSKKPATIKHGDRVGQLVLMPIPNVELIEEFGPNLNRHSSNRSGGFGSTGAK